MTYPKPEDDLPNLKLEVLGEYRDGYYAKHGKWPSVDECVKFWDEYLEKDDD